MTVDKAMVVGQVEQEDPSGNAYQLVTAVSLAVTLTAPAAFSPVSVEEVTGEGAVSLIFL